MNILTRDKRIEIISCLTEGMGVRATARITGTNRETVGKLALQVGRGCAELHDRLMTGIRTNRLELDEAWSFVAKKQRRVARHELFAKGDQYIFMGIAGTQKAIISYRVGKRDMDNTLAFVEDLRERVIGAPEISTDGFAPYRHAINAAFKGRASHGVIVKTLAVTDLRKDAAHRYSPAAVVAVSREIESGLPTQISTSFAERGNLSLRMGSRRFTRLTNGFSKRLDHHVAAVSLYVAHFNLCRVHETLSTTPAVAVGITNHVWSIGELLDAALSAEPPVPTTTAPDRRRMFRVIQGGRV